MSRFLMLTVPAAFVAKGHSLEEARAEALQADRAAVLQHMPHFKPCRWFTHLELPEDPYKPASSLFGDPWSEPLFLAYEPPVFVEGLFSRSMRTLLLTSMIKQWQRQQRSDFLRRDDTL